MSFRLLTTRLYKHGRLLVQNYLKRDIHVSNVWTGPTESTKVNKINETLRHDLRINDFRNNSFLRFGNQARRLFIDNVLNRVTNPYSVDLRLQATKKYAFRGYGIESGRLKHSFLPLPLQTVVRRFDTFLCLGRREFGFRRWCSD